MLPKKRKPTHPGEILLEDFLKPMEITQVELAEHLKWPQARVNEIVRGRRGITPESALALADAFDTTPEFWLNLQQNHDLWLARDKHKKKRKLSKAS